MSTVLDDGAVKVVRCNGCRLLWPVAVERLLAGAWGPHELDVHWCPACIEKTHDEEAHAGSVLAFA